MDPIKMLTKDHDKVKRLFEDLVGTTNRAVKKRSRLLEEIATELKIHTALEEEIFYPAFRKAGKKAGDDKLYYEALEEHRAVEDLILPDLSQTAPDSSAFSGRAKVLKELVEHHASEEEDELFPRAEQLLGKKRLAEIGEQMAVRKRELKASL